MGDLKTLVKGFSTTPFLFIGSGFSRRYYNLPDWEGLLRVFAKRINPDEFAYDAYLSKLANKGNTSKNEILPAVAGLIENDFNVRWYEDPSFRVEDEICLGFVREGQSPFKVEVCQYIHTHSKLVEDKSDEVELFRRISAKSIAGIITTNYDDFLERNTDEYKIYVGQEQLVFSAIQGWAEVYKIHGSVSSPQSIIITDADYRDFQANCPYLAAKLMTIFMEYPIIFMGYSLNDPNVLTILGSIVACLSDENLAKLQDRFIYVEWKKDQKEVEISAASITLSGKVLRMTCIRTDDFRGIFEALETKRASLPAKLIRMFKQEFYTYALTNHPTATIHVTELDDERVKDGDLVLAIARPSELARRGLKGLTSEEWYRHIVMDDICFSADYILEDAYPHLISANNILPLNKLLAEAKYSHPECNDKVKKTFDSLMNYTILRYRPKRNIKDRSIKGILRDSDQKAALCNITFLKENEIDLTDLEEFLVSCYQHDKNFMSSLESNCRSNFKRIVRIYDFLKYGKQARSKITQN